MIIAMPLALSTAPLQIRSASPSGRQMPRWSQWPSTITASPLRPRPGRRAITLLDV
jgi:hypothetical protein